MIILRPDWRTVIRLTALARGRGWTFREALGYVAMVAVVGPLLAAMWLSDRLRRGR